ncbi:MAG: 50S ribosomal protein L31 [Candidatus Daviesbacteria bacterium]|nr:50S ribosomal protein L31 [Candidatus Daviesbacteria bacterium]
MKANIHPTWNTDAKITCVCGNTFTAGSTQEQIRVEICSACHPFFTGQQKFVDTQGQVEKFSKALEVSKAKKESREKILENRAMKVAVEKTEKPSLRDLLMQARKKSAS